MDTSSTFENEHHIHLIQETIDNSVIDEILLDQWSITPIPENALFEQSVTINDIISQTFFMSKILTKGLEISKNDLFTGDGFNNLIIQAKEMLLLRWHKSSGFTPRRPTSLEIRRNLLAHKIIHGFIRIFKHEEHSSTLKTMLLSLQSDEMIKPYIFETFTEVKDNIETISTLYSYRRRNVTRLEQHALMITQGFCPRDTANQTEQFYHALTLLSQEDKENRDMIHEFISSKEELIHELKQWTPLNEFYSVKESHADNCTNRPSKMVIVNWKRENRIDILTCKSTKTEDKSSKIIKTEKDLILQLSSTKESSIPNGNSTDTSEIIKITSKDFRIHESFGYEYPPLYLAVRTSKDCSLKLRINTDNGQLDSILKRSESARSKLIEYINKLASREMAALRYHLRISDFLLTHTERKRINDSVNQIYSNIMLIQLNTSV